MPSRAQRLRRLLVAEPREVDGGHRLPEGLGQRGDRRDHLRGLGRRGRLGERPALHELLVLLQRVLPRAPRLAAVARVEGVAEHAHEVAEVVVRAQQAWLAQHLHVGLLDQVLGVGVRSAQADRRPVETVDVIAQAGGIERPKRIHGHRRAVSLPHGSERNRAEPLPARQVEQLGGGHSLSAEDARPPAALPGDERAARAPRSGAACPRGARAEGSGAGSESPETIVYAISRPSFS